MITSRRFRRLLAATLIALLATSLWPASATRVAAADDSNIPGVPLPGNVVTGQLGGPIYDHVYQVTVPPASVILLSLTGDPQADFGLYLFDSSATTVYKAAGQVAQSAVPGPNQSITYPTIGGGQFFIDLNGASNVQGQFRLVVAVERDTVPPVAEIRLDGGAPATADQTVRVTLIGTDDLSGVALMQMSVDGTTFGAFVPYTPTFLWSFSGGDGVKRLWTRVRDRAGNVSPIATASIVLDTVAPSVFGREPGPNGVASGLTPTLSVIFDEPIDPATWVNQGLVVQRLDGSTVSGTYAWSTGKRLGTFVPGVALTPGEPVALSLSGITDLAGNPLNPIGTWLVTPLRTHTVTVVATPAVVTSGGSVTFRGQIDGPVFGQMTLEALVGTSWTAMARIHIDASDRFSISTAIDQNTWYRVHADGSQVEAPSNSPAVRVLARRGLSIAGVSSTGTTTVALGTVVKAVAQVTPALPNATVTLTVSRLDTTTRIYVTVATLRQASAAGRATFAWRPTARGSYLLRLTTGSTAQFANGISAAYRWTVK